MKEELIKKIKTNPKVYKRAIKIYTDYNKALNNRTFRKFVGFFNGHKEEKKGLIALKEYCDNNRINRNIIEDKQEREEFHALYFEGQDEIIYKKETPEVYWCVLNNVSVLGGDETLIVSDKLLNDRVSWAQNKYIKFETPNLFKDRNNEYFLYAKKGKRIEKAIPLLGKGNINYYHFTYDILSRMAFVNDHPELKDVPILFDQAITRHEEYIKLIKIVDKYKHPIIFVNEGETREIGTLYWFSQCTFRHIYCLPGYDNKKESFAKLKKCIDMYRDEILNIDIKSKTYQKIFISRGAKYTHRCVNEDEVADHLKQKGFTIINLDDYSLLEQANLFNNADIIIGDEGAAMANVLYGGKHTTIGCIMPSTWYNNNYSTIAKMSGVNFVYLDAKDLKKNRTHIIDLDYLDRFIDSLTK